MCFAVVFGDEEMCYLDAVSDITLPINFVILIFQQQFFPVRLLKDKSTAYYKLIIFFSYEFM